MTHFANLMNFPRLLLEEKGGGGGDGGGDKGGDKGAGGGEGGPWYAPYKFDPETVAYIEERKFADLPTMVKSGIEGSRLAGARNVITKPDPAKLAEWPGWRDLGFPEDPAKYELKAPEEGKYQFERDGELWDAVKKIGVENRILPAQLQAVHDGVMDLFAKRMEGVKAAGDKALQDTEKALRAKWPGTDYDQKIELSKRAAKALAEKAGVKLNADQISALEKAVGDAPALMAVFAEAGALMGEDSLRGAGGSPAGAMTPAAAEAELNRLEGDAEWMKIFNDQRHAQHAAYKARRDALLEIMARAAKAA